MEAFTAAGRTAGAPVDLADGFIHLSSASQLEETARRHFADAERMWVLAVREEALGEDLKWEASRGGALFPHHYAELRADQVAWTREVTRSPAALWVLGALES